MIGIIFVGISEKFKQKKRIFLLNTYNGAVYGVKKKKYPIKI